MNSTAYFDINGKCLCVANAPLDPSSYNNSAPINDGVKPDTIWFDGTDIKSREVWDSSAIPNELITGSTYNLNTPANSVLVYDNSVVSSPFAIPTGTEQTIEIYVEGRYIGSKVIKILDLETKRTEKLNDLSTEFSQRLILGCASAKGWVDCDDKAVGRVTATIMMYDKLGLPPTQETQWTMFDKHKEPHNYADLVALGAAIAQGFQEYFTSKQTIEDSIMAATNETEINSIDITVGWP